VIRLFAAVAIPLPLAEELSRRQHGVEGARWRPADTLHVTLRFFGEIAEDQAGDLDGELARIVERPFELSLQGAGAFGEGRDVRAVWAGVADSEPLKRIAARCETAARRAGLAPETRPYRPHVTLAYCRRADPRQVAAWIAQHNLLKTPPFRVTWFGLWASHPHPEGSRYDLQREYALG